MTITATGAISFSDLRTEFVGGSSAISLGDLYRGGSNIRKLASDNTATNDAASVPTGGAINMANFYGTAKSFTKTYSSGATNQDASAIFGDDYDVNYPKNIVINSGVELGATSTSEEALEIPAGGAGTITVTNNGTLSGAGGAAGGGTGGNAFKAGVACTLINNGTIRAGGGGGGAGGTGGQGSYTASTYTYHVSYNYWYTHGYSETHYAIRYNNSWVRGSYFSSVSQMIYASVSSWSIYSKTGSAQHTSYDEDGQPFRRYAYYRSSTAYSNGGAGGAGGKGQGYVSANASGSSGASGSNNSGAVGTGGTGGTYGNSGGTGNTGANGNYTNGSAGSSGGAAGKYITGISFVTYTNNGTNLGGTA